MKVKFVEVISLLNLFSNEAFSKCLLKKMKNILSFPFKAIVVICIFFANACCENTEVDHKLPSLTTSDVVDFSAKSAVLSGNVTSDGGDEVTERGFCWGKYPNPSISDSKISNGKGTGSFSSTISDLTPLTPYYVRAYAINIAGTAYGNQVSFTSKTDAISPVVVTHSVLEVKDITAKVSGEVSNATSDGVGTIIRAGVHLWQTNSLGGKFYLGERSSASPGFRFFVDLVGLVYDTRYEYQAFVVSSNGLGSDADNIEDFITGMEPPVSFSFNAFVDGNETCKAFWAGKVITVYIGSSLDDMNSLCSVSVNSSGTSDLVSVPVKKGTYWFKFISSLNSTFLPDPFEYEVTDDVVNNHISLRCYCPPDFANITFSTYVDGNAECHSSWAERSVTISMGDNASSLSAIASIGVGESLTLKIEKGKHWFLISGLDSVQEPFEYEITEDEPFSIRLFCYSI